MGRCSRCGRACWEAAEDASRWNGEVDQGILVGLICPECQTPEEHIGAEVNESTLDYANAVPDAAGRPIVAPLGAPP
ncbi:hypothetical protein ACIOHO_39660 [Streptomyces sp. NPDC087849]|uniref:hypothetical protein n=1 Tax=Streptomyces sp. NPDC087849 TaxID=3365808 RepID=UPI00382E39F1